MEKWQLFFSKKNVKSFFFFYAKSSGVYGFLICSKSFLISDIIEWQSVNYLSLLIETGNYNRHV